MYVLPAAGPGFMGHIAVILIAAVATFGKSLIMKFAHKNG